MCTVFCLKANTVTYHLKTAIEQQYASHKFQAYNTRKLLKPQNVVCRKFTTRPARFVF